MPSAHGERTAAAVFGSELYRESVARPSVDVPAPAPFDRIEFSSSNVPGYLRQFAMHTPFEGLRS
jgi:hypothetical protein